MNKIMKKIILASVVLTALVVVYGTTRRVHRHQFMILILLVNTQPILDMFKKDWYWLDASYEHDTPEAIIYKLKNRTPHINPLYTGTMAHKKVLRENNQLVGFITYHKEGADSGRILYLGVNILKMRGKRYGEVLARYALNDLIAMGSKENSSCDPHR